MHGVVCHDSPEEDINKAQEVIKFFFIATDFSPLFFVLSFALNLSRCLLQSALLSRS